MPHAPISDSGTGLTAVASVSSLRSSGGVVENAHDGSWVARKSAWLKCGEMCQPMLRMAHQVIAAVHHAILTVTRNTSQKQHHTSCAQYTKSDAAMH